MAPAPAATITPVDTLGERCRNERCRTRPAAGYAPRGLCQWCEDTGLDAIEDLPAAWSAVTALTWDKLKTAPGGVGGKFGPSDPINYAAVGLAYEIAYTATVWEDPVREAARLSDTPPRCGPLGYQDVRRAARILSAHYSVLLAHGSFDHYDHTDRPATCDGVDAVLTLTSLCRRARSMAGVTVRVQTLPGLCSVEGCGREALRHRVGSGVVYCAGCRAEWTWDEYQDAVSLVPVGRAG